MADKMRAKDASVPGGNDKSSGTGGGHGKGGGARVKDPAGNARLKGKDPSPDDRRRGETSPTSRA